MKSLIFFFAIFIFSNTGCLYAQQLQDSLSLLSKPELSRYYNTKAKHQRTAGLLLLGGGLGLAMTGLAINYHNANKTLNILNGNNATPSKANTKGVGLAIAGCVFMVSSIPFLIAKGINRRKARLVLQNQSTSLTPSFRINQTMIGIRIPLGG